jgi:hypothetical protein
MFFSFKTVGELQVIYQPLYRAEQIRAGEYAVGRKIGLERVNTLIMQWKSEGKAALPTIPRD